MLYISAKAAMETKRSRHLGCKTPAADILGRGRHPASLALNIIVSIDVSGREESRVPAGADRPEKRLRRLANTKVASNRSHKIQPSMYKDTKLERCGRLRVNGRCLPYMSQAHADPKEDVSRNAPRHLPEGLFWLLSRASKCTLCLAGRNRLKIAFNAYMSADCQSMGNNCGESAIDSRLPCYLCWAVGGNVSVFGVGCWLDVGGRGATMSSCDILLSSCFYM